MTLDLELLTIIHKLRTALQTHKSSAIKRDFILMQLSQIQIKITGTKE